MLRLSNDKKHRHLILVCNRWEYSSFAEHLLPKLIDMEEVVHIKPSTTSNGITCESLDRVAESIQFTC